MYIFEAQDFQLWNLTEEGYLVDKIGQLPFKDQVWVLPKEGTPGYIESATSKKLLSPKSNKKFDQTEAILKAKRRCSNRASTSAENVTDSQLWLISPPNNFGWFKIMHKDSGKFLTSSESGKVMIEDPPCSEKPKKCLVKVKKNTSVLSMCRGSNYFCSI